MGAKSLTARKTILKLYPALFKISGNIFPLGRTDLFICHLSLPQSDLRQYWHSHCPASTMQKSFSDLEYAATKELTARSVSGRDRQRYALVQAV